MKLKFRVKNKDYNEELYNSLKKGGNKMKKIKETLWKDYEKVNSQINSLEVGNENYKLLLEEEDKIRNELIKLELADIEAETKKSQIEAEDRREIIRNRITIGTFGVSTVISVLALYKTFKFDESSTVTSTLGRGILNGVVPKIFKR